MPFQLQAVVEFASTLALHYPGVMLLGVKHLVSNLEKLTADLEGSDAPPSLPSTPNGVGHYPGVRFISNLVNLLMRREEEQEWHAAKTLK